MTSIGTVIEEGDQIPEDVIGLLDVDDDPWLRMPNGHWHSGTSQARRCLAGTCANSDDPLRYPPVTVAAVRS